MPEPGEVTKPTTCRICDRPLKHASEIVAGVWIFDCPRCGRYEPVYGPKHSATLESVLRAGGRSHPLRKARLSHIIRRQQRQDSSHVALPVNDLANWRLDDPLPTPAQQLDSLVIWCGARLFIYSHELELPLDEVSAWIGAPLAAQAISPIIWLVKARPDLFENKLTMQAVRLRLTMEGWERYEALRRDAPNSRSAFLAMKFGDVELNRVVVDCFQPAAARAGFELTTLVNKQPAGSIDDQMRVRLRTSRFVVADLTHGNQGAYWEAGFAEGLSRPVIYTCRKAEWDSVKTHFDTNHLVTIVWDPADLSGAAENLTATIRATLPAEAVMEDR